MGSDETARRNPRAHPDVDRGYLNPRTGEIVFVSDKEGVTAALLGDETAVDYVFNRATVEASPDDWIEIPKFSRETRDEEQTKFMKDFLRKHGIEAELVSRTCTSFFPARWRDAPPHLPARLTRLPDQSGKTLTRMFLKYTLLIWPGIGGCPWRAKVPRGNQVPVLFGMLCLMSARGTR